MVAARDRWPLCTGYTIWLKKNTSENVKIQTQFKYTVITSLHQLKPIYTFTLGKNIDSAAQANRLLAGYNIMSNCVSELICIVGVCIETSSRDDDDDDDDDNDDTAHCYSCLLNCPGIMKPLAWSSLASWMMWGELGAAFGRNSFVWYQFTSKDGRDIYRRRDFCYDVHGK